MQRMEIRQRGENASMTLLVIWSKSVILCTVYCEARAKFLILIIFMINYVTMYINFKREREHAYAQCVYTRTYTYTHKHVLTTFHFHE